MNNNLTKILYITLIKIENIATFGNQNLPEDCGSHTPDNAKNEMQIGIKFILPSNVYWKPCL